jgi:NADH dehydrogenase
MACFRSDAAAPLPGVAPVALQQGKFVAAEIMRRNKGRQPREFRYRDRGQMATIGRAAAVAEIAGLRFSGYPAWLVWLFVHLMMLVGFENRLLVFTQWCWNYITRNRAARLITQSDASLVKDSRLTSVGGVRGGSPEGAEALGAGLPTPPKPSTGGLPEGR